MFQKFTPEQKEKILDLAENLARRVADLSKVDRTDSKYDVLCVLRIETQEELTEYIEETQRDPYS